MNKHLTEDQLQVLLDRAGLELIKGKNTTINVGKTSVLVLAIYLNKFIDDYIVSLKK